MTYPSRDDYEAREQRERAQRDDDVLRAARWRDELGATGVCPRRVEATDLVRPVCEVCQHAVTLHPGFFNPDPDLTGCLVCHLKLLAAASAAPRPHRRAQPSWSVCCPDFPICSH